MTPRPPTATGLEPNVAAALSYALAWVTGLIFFLIEPDNKFVRFHALQSIFLSLAVFVIYGGISLVVSTFAVIPGLGLVLAFLGWLLTAAIGFGFFVLWILLMIRAYQGEKFKLPVVGDLADQNS